MANPKKHSAGVQPPDLALFDTDIINDLRVGLLLQMRDGRIAFANRTASQVFGLERESITSKTSEDPLWQMCLEDGTPIDGSDHPSMVTLRTGRPMKNVIRALFRTDKERRRWLSISTEPLFEEGPEPQSVLITFTDITEQREAELSARTSEHRYRTVFEVVPVGILVAEVDAHRFRYANRAMCDFLGYSGEELSTMSFLDIHPQDRLDEVAEVFHALKRGTLDTARTVPCVTKTGSIRYADISTTQIEFDDGPHLAGFFVDVTDIRAATKSAKEQKTRYENLLENIPDVAWTSHADGRTVYISKRVEDVFGFSTEEIEHNSRELWFDRIHPDDTERIDAEWRKLFEEGKPLDVTYRIRHAHGHWIWLHDRSSKTYIRDGELYADGVFSDITGRKHVEQQLRMTQFAVDQASPSIFWIRADGSFAYVNDSACRRLEYSRAELLEMTVADLDPDTPQEVRPHRWEKYKKEESATFETRHQTKSGRIFPVEVSSHYLRYGDAEYEVAYAQDISDRKRLEERLLQAQKMEAIGTLAGGIAHDFNNILTMISGFNELAIDLASGNEELLDCLDQVATASNRARDLVQQMLTYSRPALADKQPLLLQDVVNDAAKLLRGSLPSTIELLTSIDPSCPAIHGNASQLHQVVMNICTNAYQAMESQVSNPGSHRPARLAITLRLRSPEAPPPEWASTPVPRGYVELIISDTGLGMDEKTLGRIFDPYFSTKRSGKGTGLGLAVVHGIVKSHAGNVEVHSVIDQGTTFQITIPASQREPTPQQGTPRPTPTTTTLRRVLAVDDEPFILKYYERLFPRLGYSVITCKDGAEALDKLEREAPIDVLLTDLTMPNMTGLELAVTVRQDQPELPIILCTGKSEDVDRERAADLGGVQLLAKPVDRRTLANALAQALVKKTT